MKKENTKKEDFKPLLKRIESWAYCEDFQKKDVLECLKLLYKMVNDEKIITEEDLIKYIGILPEGVEKKK